MKTNNKALLIILLCIVIVSLFVMMNEQNDLNAKVNNLNNKTDQGIQASMVAIKQTEVVANSLPKFKSLCKKEIGFDYPNKNA